MTSVTQSVPVVSDKSLVLCAISGRNPKKTLKKDQTYRVTVWRGMTKLQKMPLGRSKSGQIHAQQSPRGKIATFSRKSRKRMIETLAKKDHWNAGQFWTLTYPDEVWFDQKRDYTQFQADLVALFKRIERAFPGAGFIWRKEIQARKSGKHIGQNVPHVHVLIDGLEVDLADARHWLRQAWHEVLTNGKCDLPKRPRIDIQGIGSSRKAMFYVSKYTAKVQEETERFENCNIQEKSFGRHWGVRGNWNMPVVTTLVITRDQFLKLRRYARTAHKKQKRFNLAKNLASWRELGYTLFWGADDTTSPDAFWNSTIGRLIEDILFPI